MTMSSVFQPGKRVYDTRTLKLGTLAGYPQTPDNAAHDLVIDVLWDGTLPGRPVRSTAWTRHLRLDCETCAKGCTCSGTCATSGCEHYACWGALTAEEATCHAAAAHRAATKAAHAARVEEYRPAVVIRAWA